MALLATQLWSDVSSLLHNSWSWLYATGFQAWPRLTDLANSNFITSLVGSLAGAFGGAWAAQRIAERSKVREDLLREVRAASAGASLLYGIANAHLGLKRQFVKALWDNYVERKKEFLLYQQARRVGTVPPQQIFNFEADLKFLNAVHSPIEALQKLLFEDISLNAAQLQIAALLFASINYLTNAISDRNELAQTWNANKPSNFEALYLGLPQASGVIDDRYEMTLKAIHDQNNDVVAFSIILAESLYNQAITVRKRLRKQFRVQGPLVNRLDFSRYGDLVPPPEDYEHFRQMLDQTTGLASAPLQ
jgi:hypothetical protein